MPALGVSTTLHTGSALVSADDDERMPERTNRVATHSFTIPLSLLLRQYQLKLVQITDFDDATLAETPVQWVHGTDLLDPTPFLTPRTVLLTTGGQFANQPSPAEEARLQHAYVENLVDAGVCALGFAVNFYFERIPEALIEACQKHQLPLFRVPYSTPFIAISQTAARLLNKESHARDAWSIAAQRAVALAALQQDGMRAIIRELSTQLGSWVAVYDATSKPLNWEPQQVTELAREPWLLEDVRTMLSHQTRASRTSSHGHERIALQTLGRRGNLLGVLAVHDSGNLDHAAQSVISIVVALASITLEQSSTLTDPTMQLRQAVVELLAGGQHALASRVASRALGELPDEPVRCASISGSPTERTEALALVQALSETSGQTLFFAQLDDEVVVVMNERAQQPFIRSLAGYPVAVGLSEATEYAIFDSALEQARLARAAADARDSSEVTRFAPAMQAGVLSILSANKEASKRANALLHPLTGNDERNGEHLVESLEVWLRHHGQFVPAATELGIHRHTLKTRIARIGQLLGKDLNEFGVRADLWAALQLAKAQA